MDQLCSGRWTVAKSSPNSIAGHSSGGREHENSGGSGVGVKMWLCVVCCGGAVTLTWSADDLTSATSAPRASITSNPGFVLSPPSVLTSKPDTLSSFFFLFHRHWAAPFFSLFLWFCAFIAEVRLWCLLCGHFDFMGKLCCCCCSVAPLNEDLLRCCWAVLFFLPLLIKLSQRRKSLDQDGV